MKKVFLLFTTMLFLQACAHPMFYRAKEFSGTVGDAETNLPLEGVVVVAMWIPRSWKVGESGYYGVLEVYEDVTDKEGRYTIPGWGPSLRPLGEYLDHRDPQLFVFKKGYQYLRLVNSDPEQFYKYYGKEKLNKLDFEEFEKRVFAISFDSKKSLRESVWDVRVIKMKKFEGSNEKLWDMLGVIQIDVFDVFEDYEAGGIPISRVKQMAKEWRDAIKELKRYPYVLSVPDRIEKMLKEEDKHE